MNHVEVLFSTPQSCEEKVIKLINLISRVGFPVHSDMTQADLRRGCDAILEDRLRNFHLITTSGGWWSVMTRLRYSRWNRPYWRRLIRVNLPESFQHRTAVIDLFFYRFVVVPSWTWNLTSERAPMRMMMMKFVLHRDLHLSIDSFLLTNPRAR